MADFLNINEVLSYLDIKKSYIACEFGCGTADFALSLAKKLDKGKVYALDIQEEKLEAVKSKMALQNLHNISVVLCDLETPKGSGLKDNFLDIVVIPNLLFQVENKYAIIEEAKRVLKPGGQCLVIDWLKSSSFGPGEALVNPDEVKKMASALGLSLKKEYMSGDYHYALLFTKI